LGLGPDEVGQKNIFTYNITHKKSTIQPKNCFFIAHDLPNRGFELEMAQAANGPVFGPSTRGFETVR